MVEYIAKNLAIELMHQSSYLSDGDLLEVNGNLAKARIEAEPAADVAPVVRCKDCKFRENDDFCTGRGFPYQLVPDDGFCDKGKRKE
jgi:hypothetical protein